MCKEHGFGDNMWTDPENCDQVTKMMGREELIEALEKSDGVIHDLEREKNELVNVCAVARDSIKQLEQDFKDLTEIKDHYRALLDNADTLIDALYESGCLDMSREELARSYLNRGRKK